MLIYLGVLIQQMIVTSTSATSPLEPSRRRLHLRSRQPLNSWRFTLLRSARSSIQTRLPNSYRCIFLMYYQPVKLINSHRTTFYLIFLCFKVKKEFNWSIHFFLYPLYLSLHFFKFFFLDADNWIIDKGKFWSIL